jgi:hypothetical protein
VKISLLLDAICSRREPVAEEVIAFISTVTEALQVARIISSRANNAKMNKSLDLTARFEGGHMPFLIDPSIR